MKNKDRKNGNYLFILVIFALIIFLDIYVFFINDKGKDYVLQAEDRGIITFPKFNFKEFITGSYQSIFENAFSDNFLGSEKIRVTLRYNLRPLKYDRIPTFICKNHSVRISQELYTYNCDDKALDSFVNIKEDAMLKNKLANYDKLNGYIDTYYYFITSPFVYNWENNTLTSDIGKIFSNNFKNKYKYDYLKISNYQDLKKYFYKTDHHWNYLGMYQAYLDIYKLLNIDENPRVPIHKYTLYDTNYYGSYAKSASLFEFKDPFEFYEYDLEDYKQYFDKSETDDFPINDYINGDYSRENLFNYYVGLFGYNYGETIYDFNHPDKENILILGNSYMTSIKNLIASHYNKTYAVDLRYFSRDFNQPFNIEEYIKNNNISKVLVIMDSFYLSNDTDIEWSN